MTIDEKLDAAVREIIHKRDIKGTHFKCISCGSFFPAYNGQVGHYISRKWLSVRHNLNNVAMQCWNCNNELMGNVDNYRRNLVERIGEDQVKELERLKNTTCKMSKREKEELLKELKLKLEEYD